MNFDGLEIEITIIIICIYRVLFVMITHPTCFSLSVSIIENYEWAPQALVRGYKYLSNFVFKERQNHKFSVTKVIQNLFIREREAKRGRRRKINIRSRPFSLWAVISTECSKYKIMILNLCARKSLINLKISF